MKIHEEKLEDSIRDHDHESEIGETIDDISKPWDDEQKKLTVDEIRKYVIELEKYFNSKTEMSEISGIFTRAIENEINQWKTFLSIHDRLKQKNENEQ
jgi:hypothetical protein